MALAVGVSTDIIWLPIRFSQIVKWFLQILDVLSFLHTNKIVHGGIHPGAFFITPALGIKLMHFGDESGLYHQMRSLDKGPEFLNIDNELYRKILPYNSLKILSGREIDARSDLYSAGAVLYHMLTNSPPYTEKITAILMSVVSQKDPDPPSQLNPEIPGPLEKYVMKLLQKNPDDRFQSAEEAIPALKEAARESGISLDS